MSSGHTATRLDFSVADFGSQSPVGAARVKDQLIGNTLYCSDQSMYRTSINWMACASGHTAAQATWFHEYGNDQYPNNFYTRLITIPSAIILPQRADGVDPVVAVHVYAGISKSLTTNTIAVCVGEVSNPDPSVDSMCVFDPVTSTSPAWLTPASGYSRYLTFRNASQSRWNECVTQRAVTGSDGAVYTTDCLEIPICILTKTDNAEMPKIWGIHAHVFSP